MPETDALQALEPASTDLLGRVDRALMRLGTPPEHPVIAPLRHLRVLPGDAFRFVAGMRPARLTNTADELRDRASGCRRMSSTLDESSRSLTWSGEGHEMFLQRWNGLTSHTDDMAGRLLATARYLDTVASWQRSARERLGDAMLTALNSQEAVILKACLALDEPPGELTGDLPQVVRAAADVGHLTLQTAAEAHDEALAAFTTGIAWPEELAALEYRAPSPTVRHFGDKVWVRL